LSKELAFELVFENKLCKDNYSSLIVESSIAKGNRNNSINVKCFVLKEVLYFGEKQILPPIRVSQLINSYKKHQKKFPKDTLS
jgi:hypothetical protein